MVTGLMAYHLLVSIVGGGRRTFEAAPTSHLSRFTTRLSSLRTHSQVSFPRKNTFSIHQRIRPAIPGRLTRLAFALLGARLWC